MTPGLLGLAASCGYDTLAVRPPVRCAVLVFGDELLTRGLPGEGRVRDCLGPSLPSWLRRLGAQVTEPIGPVEDTLDAHVDALRTAIDQGAELVCTTGGTMHGPVDHLHPALAELGAAYVVNTVEVRPGFPMLLASAGTTVVAGLPGNPQSAIVALVSLVAPALAGLTGRTLPELPRIRLGAPVPGRGGYTHLALVDRAGRPVPHVGSAMLRGLAAAVGFAVIPPGRDGAEGDEVALVPLRLLEGDQQAAALAGLQFGAQIVITGQAISKNAGGMPTGLMTSRAAPLSDMLRTVQLMPAAPLNAIVPPFRTRWR